MATEDSETAGAEEELSNLRTDISRDQGIAGGGGDLKKYLTFVLQKEEYGIGILRVREIIGFMDVTPVPRTPDFVKGVINLRGQVIPVIDLRKKFGMPEAEITRETCIIVVEVKREDEEVVQMGIVVDNVEEVLDIPEGNIDPSPSFGAEIDTEYIQGMGKVDEEVKILLDIDRVLEDEELVEISNIDE